jgi:hypothetical protein
MSGTRRAPARCSVRFRTLLPAPEQISSVVFNKIEPNFFIPRSYSLAGQVP